MLRLELMLIVCITDFETIQPNSRIKNRTEDTAAVLLITIVTIYVCGA